MSPKARVELGRPGRFAVELAVWLAAAGALAHAGRPRLALAFLVLALASGTAHLVWSRATPAVSDER